MNNSNQLYIKNFFDFLYQTYNNKEYIKTDPIRFPYEFKGNTEFIAFTASCFAYGNMKAIQSFLFRYFDYAGTDPFSLKTIPNDKLYYRFQNFDDVAAYSLSIKKIYEKYGSIENLFREAGVISVDTADKGIKLFRSFMGDISKGLNFLLPVPGKSASKRLYMFMRWMIRKDDVDFGLWKTFDKSSLYMPVDTHILRMASHLGIIETKDTGRKSVEKVTDFFKLLNPADPAKYDFSITRLGIVTGCQYALCNKCSTCIHNIDCLFN